jgi:hypothetical protein
VTDITYVWTAEGWLYLAAILDLFSRGGFKPGVGQKGIGPDAFGQPGGAGIRPEAFGVGRREDPHFRAVTWDVRNPGGGVMDEDLDAADREEGAVAADSRGDIFRT